MEKSTPLWCEDCRFVSFETGLGKPILTLNDPNGFKNSTNVYSIHLELRMALPCQISIGKWKYVNPCLDFLGIPDQRTAYVKRQARARWTYVRRSSVTPDLIMGDKNSELAITLKCRFLVHKQSSIPLTGFWLNPKFDQNMKCSDSKCARLITTKFCTRHDSVTVVTCAKFPCGRPNMLWTKALQSFIEFRIRSKYR